MERRRAFILWLGVAVLLGTGFVLGRSDMGRTEEGPLAELAVRTDDHVRGNVDTAKIVVIEYSDTECQYCKSFHQKFQEQVFGPHADTVAWIYRHYLLPIYPKSAKEAEALECAAQQRGNDMFWQFLEALYAVTPFHNDLDPAELPKLAQQLKLDSQEFNRCLSEGDFAEKVNTQKLEGAAFGVHQTPSVIIWNKMTDEKKLISGANSRFLEVKRLIEIALQNEPL